jgi:hypothetical protein
MLTSLIAWLRGEVASVEKLITSSTSLITKLEATAAAKVNESIEHSNAAAAAEYKAMNASTEAQRATDIATKLKGIFA